jgi:hypothetical protein
MILQICVTYVLSIIISCLIARILEINLEDMFFIKNDIRIPKLHKSFNAIKHFTYSYFSLVLGSILTTRITNFFLAPNNNLA